MYFLLEIRQGGAGDFRKREGVIGEEREMSRGAWRGNRMPPFWRPAPLFRSPDLLYNGRKDGLEGGNLYEG
ncbi:hypothetical protein HMPREF1986_01465 [Oribacterium sp. oral taxon 078 str. F0263]|nr:hypothetical protein GCWU000341_01749 [Oribacterium sp. oral taxon 078 str. F0262]ERL21283.1 hypothetical protein HMPREF1986_01465 [Oribacterium sp. oral taxon 078 str. F0263]